MANLALVDADSIYFRVAYKTKKKNEIRKNIDIMMKEIEGQCFMPDEMKVAVKGIGNFRKDIYPDYKVNRKALEPDMKEALTYGHNYMIEKWNAVQADGMEADDLVSIWAYEARENEDAYVVVGIDKDLKQIPGNHYNFVKKEHVFIDDDEAYMLLMIQALTGDTSDNIPGIKGVGPVKAKKLLAGRPKERLWDRVKAAWRANGTGDPSISLRLLTMIKSWEEFNEISNKTTVSKQDVLPKQEQDS